MKVKGYLGSVELGDGMVTIRKKPGGSTVVPLEAVQGVSIVPAGVGMKAIRVAVAGGTLHGPQTAIGSHRGMAHDPYAVTFYAWKSGRFEKFASEVMKATTT